MQLHEKMRADRHVEGFRGMRDLEPRRDSADARDVDLHDRARAPRHIFAEVPDRVHQFADRDRRRGGLAKPDMAVAIVGRQRLLDPSEIEIGEAARAADRLVEREALIGVGHDLVIGAERRAHRRKATIVLRRARPTDLDLRARETLFARGDRVVDQRLLVDMQPAALGRVERPAVCGAARGDPER